MGTLNPKTYRLHGAQCGAQLFINRMAWGAGCAREGPRAFVAPFGVLSLNGNAVRRHCEPYWLLAQHKLEMMINNNPVMA